ncbi:MAG TPA: hypothetical protein VFH83_06630, partial [Spirochaetia bacterium]|nr:hypothetical protein [Spirochaetia bacterium]
MKPLLTAAVLCLASAGVMAQNVPVAPSGVVEYQGRTQVVVTIDNLDLLAEGLGRLEPLDGHTGFGYRSVTVGGYYRVIPNLKLGAFYRLQAGARHDDDWIQTGPNPDDWGWQDTTSRWENVLMLDASPRFLLSFLPGA